MESPGHPYRKREGPLPFDGWDGLQRQSPHRKPRTGEKLNHRIKQKPSQRETEGKSSVEEGVDTVTKQALADPHEHSCGL